MLYNMLNKYQNKYLPMKFTKTISSLLLLAITQSLIVNTAFASDKLDRELKDFEEIENIELASTEKAVEKEKAEEKKEVCGFFEPEEKTYTSQLIAVRRKLRLEENEAFRVKVFLKNTGNMPWFSDESTCMGPHMALGTDQERDRNSTLYAKEIEGIEDTNWESKNRVGMDQLRVDPGQIASFTFWSETPGNADIIKEYFTPVLEGISWIEDSKFSFEIIVGDPDQNPVVLKKRMLYANMSGSVMDIPLEGEKVIVVDLSEQRLYVKLNDYLVREFRVSTGAAATPTPTGEYSIKLKQEMRIGSKKPHYRMPKFMWWRDGGYGFHALPSLGSDGGVFWTEARNHIGIPVSHGCIRLLPEDATFLFDFADIGTKVAIQR